MQDFCWDEGNEMRPVQSVPNCNYMGSNSIFKPQPAETCGAYQQAGPQSMY